MSEQSWGQGTHPVLRFADVLDAALADVVDVDPVFMSTADKRDAITRLARAESRIKELQLRVQATAHDVAEDEGARDLTAWMTHHARLDRSQARREQRLAEALESRWHRVAAGMRGGDVTFEQAHVIARALDKLPDDLDPVIVARAEARLVEEALSFGPHELRVMGRRILDVVAPELGEQEERKALEAEELEAEAATRLTGRRRGDGTTDLVARVPDPVYDRLLTYLEAFLSPRQPGQRLEAGADRRPYERQLGAAFVSFLETIDPTRLPLHGGDATTVIVTLDHQNLLDSLESNGVALLGDQPISAGEARRLACTASIIPAVLGGRSEVLDLGRGRRLFSRAQRKALALHYKTCGAKGCDVPVEWTEVHHLKRWARGGSTDLKDGIPLCGHHHRRAHDHRYDHTLGPDRELTFGRKA